MKFLARIGEGKFDFGGKVAVAKFHEFAKKNVGLRVIIEPLTPESKQQRKYFEGCIISLITFYQENLDHRNTEHRRMVREWLKIEFNGDVIAIQGKTHKIAKTTVGELNRGFLEKVTDWLQEQYAPPMDALLPESYKKWRDEVFPFGGPDNYIDYLIECGILKSTTDKTIDRLSTD